ARLAGHIPLHNNRIRIPETLLISAISMIDDVSRCVTMDAKPGHDGSAFYYIGLSATDWEDVRLDDAAAMHQTVARLIASGQILAAHDVSESGVLPALAEMAFAGLCGARVQADAALPWLTP